MTPEESNIMADMFYFLRDHYSLPQKNQAALLAYWEKTATDICELVSGKWHDHPLATQLGLAILNYLEGKA